MSRVLLFGLCVLAVSARAQDATRVFEAARAVVVTVRVFDARKQMESQGSGVVIGAQRVATNCHVVEGGRLLTVTPDGGTPLAATVLRRDRVRDLCILDVPALSVRSAVLREEALEVGTRLHSVGNPLGFGLAVGSGLLSAYKGEGAERRLIVTAPLSPGSSGGGIFDERARLVGITTSAYFLGQSLGVAVPAAWIREVEQHGEQDTGSAEIEPDRDWLREGDRLRSKQDWNALAAHARAWLAEYPTSPFAKRDLGLAESNLGNLESARSVLAEAVRSMPADQVAHAYLAVVLLKLKQPAAAEREARAAIDQHPSEAYSWAVLGEVQRAAGKAEDAKRAFRNALRLEPAQITALTNLADIAFRERSWDEAVRLNRLLLALHQDTAAVRHNLARALAAKGLPEEARKALEPAAPTSQSARAWFSIGQQEMDKRNFAEAERAFRKALESDPGDAMVWGTLAVALAETGRKFQAEEAARKSLELKPANSRTAYLLGMLLLERNQKAEAVEWLTRACALEPRMIEGWQLLARVKVDSGDWAGALAALEKVVALDGASATDWAMLADVRTRLGQMDGARAAAERALKMDPQNVLAIGAISGYYERIGEHAKALEHIDRALKLNPGNPAIWNSKGHVLLRLGRLDDALDAFRTSLRLAPDYVPALTNLGQTYLARKEPAMAIRYLEQALKRAPEATEARLYLARAFVATEQPEVAKQYIEPLLGQATDNMEVAYTTTQVYVMLADEPQAQRWYARLKALSAERARQLAEWHGSLGQSAKRIRLDDAPGPRR